MDECYEMINKMNEKAVLLLLRIPEECQKTFDWLNSYRDEIRIKMVQAQAKTCDIPVLPKTPSRHKVTKRLAISTSTSSDQDESPSKTETESSNVRNISEEKPKRNASKLAGLKINKQANTKLNTKMRRPTALEDLSSLLNSIKVEKKSASPVKESQTKPELKNVKKENMPPPASKPKRGRKKIKKEVDSSDTENSVNTSSTSTRSVASTRAKGKNNRKDSDVIIQETQVPIVVVTDSDVEDCASNTEDSKQVANTTFDTDDDQPLKSRKRDSKTKKKVGKKSKKTQQKSNDVNKNNEDLNSTHVIEKSTPVLNETHVISKDSEEIAKSQNAGMNCTVVLEKNIETLTLPPQNLIAEKTANTPLMNCTIVLERMNETVTLPPKNNEIEDQTVGLPKQNGHHWKKANVPLPVDNLLTDDDDSIVKKTPEKKPESARQGIKTKQMFSPYSNSPVKKRVAAFEKLVGNDSADMPTRVTRTKTRNLKDKDNQAQINSELTSSKIPAKSKYFTPIENKKLTSLIPQSDTKAYRQVGKINTLPTKSASAAKPSRAEVQLRREEEQKKRLEKEDEVKRKREAIMQAKAEEQRKRREEKQIKAQKAREEMEREKEEKLRALQKEKEDELQKKREWQAQKLAEIEEKKKMELLRMRELEKLRKLEEQRKKMQAVKPPPLPTDDCDDSDSSSESSKTVSKYQKPDWAQSQNLSRTLLCQRFIPKKSIETLFCMEATTPDLREIFETVDEKILRRNSSAVWRTPPRYSTLPKY